MFQAGLSRSAKKDMINNGHDPSMNFDDLEKARVVEERMLDEQTAEVVVETTDGNKRRATFQMIWVDGEWKLTEQISQ